MKSSKLWADLRVETFLLKELFRRSNNFRGRGEDVGCPWSNHQKCLRHKKSSIAFPLRIEKKNWNQNTIRIYPKFSNRFFEIKITFLRVLKVFVILPVFESRCVSVFFPIRLFLIYCDAILRALLRSRQKRVIFLPFSEPCDLFMVMFINFTIWAPSNSCLFPFLWVWEPWE